MKPPATATSVALALNVVVDALDCPALEVELDRFGCAVAQSLRRRLEEKLIVG